MAKLSPAMGDLISQALGLFGARMCLVFVKDENTGKLSVGAFATSSGVIDHLPAQIEVLLQGVFGLADWVLRNKRALIIDEGPPNIIDPGPRLGRVGQYRTHPVLCVPAEHHDEVVGVVVVIDSKSGHFTEPDQRKLSRVAQSIAAGLDRDRNA